MPRSFRWSMWKAPLCIGWIALWAGCSPPRGGPGKLLVGEADFEALTKAAFPPSAFVQRGNGSSGGVGDSAEYHADLEPVDPAAVVDLDFGVWLSHLEKSERFSRKGQGGTPGQSWQATWMNDARYVHMQASILKNGMIHLTYGEVLR